MTHYIHDEKNNRIEGMSKEEIYALLAEAIQTGQLPSVDEDTAFVTMFKSIVDGKTYKMAFCTQAQYNQLEAQGLLVADAYYIITDDETYDELVAIINENTTDIENIKNYLNNGNLDIKELLSFINNTTSEKSKWLMLPVYSYRDFDVGSGTEEVLQAVIKQICIDYPNKNHYSFFGTVEPNSNGIYFIHIYNTSELNSNGLPRYAFGFYIGGQNTLVYFGTWEFNFQYYDNPARISQLETKTLYTNNSNYNLTPSNWVTLNLSETITNTSILELYATLRINDSTVYSKFNGKVQLSTNLFTDVFISFPMFNYGAGSSQAIGMVVIYVKYNSTTSVQVKLDCLGIANSSIFVNSLPTTFNAKIDKILLINN